MKGIDIALADGIVMCAYLAILIYAGVHISKKNSLSKTSSSEDLFLSGRSLPWYKFGLSIFSTNVSPSMLVAYFGAVYTGGMVLANFEWMAIVHTGMIQPFLLLGISFATSFIGPGLVGGVENLVESVPAEYRSIFRPAS
jgi:SSS family solute:Na+ symporter